MTSAAHVHLKKLHIGTGKCYLPGYINADIFSSVRADVYADMAALPFDRRSFTEIYCSHTLEHAHRSMVAATLTHWRDLLVDGGLLRLAVPDFGAAVEWYNRTGDLRAISGLLWGGQNHPKNNHFIGFDKKTLTEELERVGFRDVREWDWRATDHCDYDDYSQAYLPSMQKDTGLLVSLNLECNR